MEASTSAEDAQDGEQLQLGVLLFIPYRALEAATLDGLARAGYPDMTLAQARIASQSRKSPVGAWTTFTIIF